MPSNPAFLENVAPSNDATRSGRSTTAQYGDTYKDFFPGSIKNVQVFDQALTPDEIKALG